MGTNSEDHNHIIFSIFLYFTFNTLKFSLMHLILTHHKYVLLSEDIMYVQHIVASFIWLP
jgi:hypothetical protein